MPTGIKPRVNEAREFLEIAKDFKDPKEIIREALSNSWDAGASEVSIRFDLDYIQGTKRRKIMVEIDDDGQGMDSKDRPGIGSSEIGGFFNLGDSHKLHGSIGSKGHGTKIYYKSYGIEVYTWKSGRRIFARTEVEPWATLRNGDVPTYRYDEIDDTSRTGTLIKVDGFQAKQSEFKNLQALIEYVRWYTVLGSFGEYFGVTREMALHLKPASVFSKVTVPFGFRFPDEQLNLTQGTKNSCKIFGPETIDCGTTSDGENITVEIVGALVGEALRGIVPHTYSHMGLWLSKDYIRIERKNEILEGVFRGQYYYRSLLIFANCQHFDLTANRNNIRSDQDEYDLAIDGIRKYCEKIKEDEFLVEYFRVKGQEDQDDKERRKKEKRQKRHANIVERRKNRINTYNGRQSITYPGVVAGPRKEPRSEAETALLLQAMISSEHPGIDFVIGEYNTTSGVDLIVEKIDKSIPSLKWVELVSSLDKLYAWDHPHEGYHMIVCYQLGNVKEEEQFPDGSKAKLVETDRVGRYALVVEGETIDVYVLREILLACGEG